MRKRSALSLLLPVLFGCNVDLSGPFTFGGNIPDPQYYRVEATVHGTPPLYWELRTEAGQYGSGIDLYTYEDNLGGDTVGTWVRYLVSSQKLIQFYAGSTAESAHVFARVLTISPGQRPPGLPDDSLMFRPVDTLEAVAYGDSAAVIIQGITP